SNAGPLADAQHVWDDLSLLFQTVIVNFEKEAIFSENILILRCCLLSLFNPSAQNVCGYLAVEASRQANQSFSMLAQKFLIYSRLIIETFKISFRYELHEVLISLLVFAEDDQMLGPAICRIPFSHAATHHFPPP